MVNMNGTSTYRKTMIMTLCDNSNDTMMGGFTPEEDRNEQKHQHPWVSQNKRYPSRYKQMVNTKHTI